MAPWKPCFPGGCWCRPYGWGYSDDLKKAVEFAMKAGMEAAVKGSGEKGARHQKPRWEKEKEKRILAETKLQEVENIKKVDTL